MEKDKRTQISMRFQRTIARLLTLRRFARKVGQDFDIEHLDISRLTRRGQSNDDKIYDLFEDVEDIWSYIRTPKNMVDLMNKQDYITDVLKYINFETFF